MKKPKRRRTTSRRQQTRIPGVPPAKVVAAHDSDTDDMLAGMMRARLALMPPQVAEDYRALAQRDNLTVAEKAKVNVLEDTYSPSRQQIQVAVSEAYADIKRNRKAAR